MKALIKKGIYTLSGIGDIYLEQGYKLSVNKSENGYIFSGKGSAENNILQQTKIPLKKFQSKNGYGLPMSAFLTEPDKFIPVVDGYRTSVNEMLGTSKNKPFVTFINLLNPNNRT